MAFSIVAGLALALTATEPLPAAPDAAHQVQLDHRGQRVDVTYRSDIDVTHRQIGAVGAPGRPSALRCAWQASVAVQREARHPAGHVLARTVSAEQPLTGSRPGWCATQKDAIARDVAARSDTVREHLLAVAARDQDALVAELDAAHGTVRG
ncbi:hypothetical protein [Sphingomonas sp. BK235]|uniref:hypothetical protein n=1 Tax=Sphingomonas sp. BK235 TaxID=2512131 RepID=UPI00104AFC31|nr:hypothetical protein [Sphingomonas sp. BK235]TCP33361.1 hypothetical protein EV292_106304 [Sphingomonas sp. BK235]